MTTNSPPTDYSVYEFTNIAHDAWLETYGPYSYRAPEPEDTDREMRIELDEYFRTAFANSPEDQHMIQQMTDIAILWAQEGSEAIDEITALSFECENLSHRINEHVQGLLKLAKSLEEYD